MLENPRKCSTDCLTDPLTDTHKLLAATFATSTMINSKAIRIHSKNIPGLTMLKEAGPVSKRLKPSTENGSFVEPKILKLPEGYSIQEPTLDDPVYTELLGDTAAR